MPRYLGGIIPNFTPDTTARSAIYTIPELEKIQGFSTAFYPTAPVLSASTFSTADSTLYTLTTQDVGDADPSKVVYLAIGVGGPASGTTMFPTGVTIGGSAAALLVSTFQVDGTTNVGIAIYGARIESATTKLTVAVNFADSTQPRIVVQTYWSKGVAYSEPYITTATTGAASSSSETLTIANVPAGAHVLTASAIRTSGGYVATYSAGSTLTALTSAGAEGLSVYGGLTNNTTALRLSHTITTTHTTNASAIGSGPVLASIVIR